MNTYRVRFWAKCPNNGFGIDYELAISTPTMIMVEEIRAFVDEIREGYHEEIADKLLARFGGRQVMRAHHHGVDIETVREAGA